MDGKKIRKWNRVIHRDLGYIAVGLTLIYAISGFVVNHVHDWNPNYEITHIKSNIGKVELSNSTFQDPQEGSSLTTWSFKDGISQEKTP